MNNMMEYLIYKNSGMNKKASDFPVLASPPVRRAPVWVDRLNRNVGDVLDNARGALKDYRKAYNERLYNGHINPALENVNSSIRDYVRSGQAVRGAQNLADDYVADTKRKAREIWNSVSPQAKEGLRGLWKRYGRGE